jgi:hypothetical protein
MKSLKQQLKKHYESLSGLRLLQKNYGSLNVLQQLKRPCVMRNAQQPLKKHCEKRIVLQQRKKLSVKRSVKLRGKPERTRGPQLKPLGRVKKRLRSRSQPSEKRKRCAKKRVHSRLLWRGEPIPCLN